MEPSRAETLLTEGCDRFVVPGAQLGLLRGEDRLVVCAGTLTAGGSEPVVRRTPFHAGSLAKSLAALVVLDAARRGDLDVDVPCDEQAPGLWPETPRGLMAQTTGRPNLLPEVDEPLEHFVRRVGELPLTHAPGRFSYCNAGWSVLDLLLQRRCGASFEELAVTALGPGTTFGMPEGAAQGHSVGADGSVHPVPPMYAAAAAAAGATWWATADQLLDHAALHLGLSAGPFHPDDIASMQLPQVRVPGATISDHWGLGWALWDRPPHRGFGWAGYTGGHRAYLRCFPDQDAAVVLLAGSAGPLFGPPGGSALFDALLPELLDLLEVPALPPADRPAGGRPVGELAGDYGPVSVEAVADDAVRLHAAAFGEARPIAHHRVGGDVFRADGDPPGGMLIAFEEGLLYVGPFALPRS